MRVVIADDSVLLREGLARVLADGGFEVVAQAANADELRQAYLVNPYDINGMKDAILEATRADPHELSRRMRAMRKTVTEHDVKDWASGFLSALAEDQQTHRKQVRPARRT